MFKIFGNEANGQRDFFAHKIGKRTKRQKRLEKNLRAKARTIAASAAPIHFEQIEPRVLLSASPIIDVDGGGGAPVLIDFNSEPPTPPGSPLTSLTIGDATFTASGGGGQLRIVGPNPNGTNSLFDFNTPRSEIRADFANGASEVSIDLGDFGVDNDRIFLEAFDADDNSLGFVDQVIFGGMHTLTLNSSNLTSTNISYIVAGARDADNGSSVFFDNLLYTPGSADVEVNEGDTADATGTFSDPDVGDIVTLSASVGNVIDTGGGTWAWSYVTGDGPADSQTVTITATDNHGDFSDVSFDLAVFNVAPTIGTDNAIVTVDEGDTANNTGSLIDPGNDIDTLTASVGSVIDNGNGTYSWSYDTGDGPDDTQTVTITVTDVDGESDDITFDLVVNNAAPIANDVSFDVIENSANGTSVGTVAASDPGDDPMTFAITGGTGTAAFAIDTNTGEITVADATELDFETVTSLTLEVTVTDDEGASVVADVTVNIINQASISGAVFIDFNEDGNYDGDEVGLDGVLVELLDENGVFLQSTTTANGGVYLFEDLDAGNYQIRETQLTGIDDGPEHLGNLGGSVLADDLMALTIATVDADDYDFAEIAQSVDKDDAAKAGFWKGKKGQELLEAGGTGLADWLTGNFGNVFGDIFVGADGEDVAEFFKKELKKQAGKKSKIKHKIDAEFMATAFATYFTNSNLAGTIAEAYKFEVSETGLGAKVVNIGDNGAAFGVADNSNLTVMQLLQATNAMTDVPDDATGFAFIYDTNGDGIIDDSEKALREMAEDIYKNLNKAKL